MSLYCRVEDVARKMEVFKAALGKFASSILVSIGIIYFFIFPVYFPIRALGIELNAYTTVLHDSKKLILFFSQITILIAFISIFLSFCIDHLNKRFCKNQEHLIVHWYRSIASMLGIVFVISSHFVLNPANIMQLYLWSGIHYFIISFFQLLIRAEINTYKNNKETSIVQANNYFGFSLNLVGIISIFIFGWFYENKELLVYSKYCSYLELIFVLYLLFIRGYVKDIRIIMSASPVKTIFSYVALMMLMLLTAAVLSLFVMSIGVLAPVITLIAIAFIYSTFKQSLRADDLKLIINISLSYGLILAAFTGSVLAYFLHGIENHIDLYNFAYSSEPFVSLLLGLIMAWILVRGNSEYKRDQLYKQVSLVNFLTPLVFIIFFISLFKDQHFLLFLIMMFGVYAFVEYMSMFYLRQVTQLSEYNNIQGSRLASFNVIVLNGLCPSLIYISVFLCTRLTSMSLDTMLINTIIGLLIISISYNFLFRQRVI